MILKDFFGRSLAKLKDKKLFLFDMDGTIYLDNQLFEGVDTLFKQIKANGGRYVFITNNSSRSIGDYVEKLQRLGLDYIEEGDFYTSSQVSIDLMKHKFGNDLIYAQGTRSFIKQLRDSGLSITEEYNENAVAVLVGFDDEITGQKLRTTCKMLTLHDVPYYATNPDWVCPVDFGYVPDCGSMCFGIEKATGKTPIFIGKPQPQMIYSAMEKFCATEEETIVIGDRIYTDIASGVNAGVDTILVLSGETTIDDYNKSEIKPKYVLDHVKQLIED